MQSTVELISEGCRCCRDLPGYLSCNPSGEASCTNCGWSAEFSDLDDAPETCPKCGGRES